ncbi:MAG: hypothetical protein OXE97_06775 [Gammaproteobacteria bacterium]|nr:hypothetical protein [Gammaproteobacteria bacterium]MCY4281807.1 hypothetical protein [Gammaproteobacteria bacterium]
MAKRPVFFSNGRERLVKEELVDFRWNPGFAPIQKKKNVSALHEAAEKKGFSPLLEISTKSEETLGQRLSAFNLKIATDIGEISLEAAYQGSKVFASGGPYTDIYRKDGRGAKKDIRVRTSGELVCFKFFEDEWPLEPKTAFYDWLYITALEPYQEFLRRLFDYKGFTDIEFNPGKSINCQARACALLVSLLKFGLLNEALLSQRDFIDITSSDSVEKNHPTESQQRNLPL